MSYKTDIFLGYVPDYKKLKEFGFKAYKDFYEYFQIFMNQDFNLKIKIDKKYRVEITVYDRVTNEEYLELNSKMLRSYTQEVKEELERILCSIKDSLFIRSTFLTAQANRICELIEKKYNDKPYFMWKTHPNHGVYKSSDTNKWYAIIMYIDRSKLDSDLSGAVEVINLKLSEARITKLLSKKGFYPAYHMNKKSWISITCDESLDDTTIMDLIEESYGLTQDKPKDWIIPANPNYFDIKKEFKLHKQLLWKQTGNIKKDDIVYMYVTRPYSSIMYKCKVIGTDIPFEYEDQNIRIKKLMKIKLIKEYQDQFMSFSRLQKYGVSTIRGPRSCPQKLKLLLD